jgi:hypothetical protein
VCVCVCFFKFLHAIRSRTLPSKSFPIHHLSSYHWILFSLNTLNLWRRDSSVGIETGYGLDDRGVGVPVPGGTRIFCSQQRPDRLWGPTHPPIQWVTVALSTGLKRLGRESDHSPPTSAEVKKMWIYTSTPPYTFIS